MAVFQAALINEIEKLYKKKKIMVAIIISLSVIIIGQLIIVGMRTGFGLRGVGSVEFPILVLSVVVNTILPLFTALVAIDCFSSEFSNNMMRVTLTRPVSRFKIFNLFVLFVFSLLAGFLFNANSATAIGLFKIVISYGVSLIPMIVLALGIILLTNIFKNGTSVFFVSILGFLILKAGAVIFSQYSSLFITSQLDWYNLWLASSFPLNTIVNQLLIMLGYAIMFFTAGYYLFDKKEY